MHPVEDPGHNDVFVTLKNGERYQGPLWTWRPKEGWLELIDEDLVRIELNQVVEAYQFERIDRSGKRKRVDLLQQAREDGWKP